MAMLRVVFAALIFAACLAPVRADDGTNRLIAAFAKICYVMPDSVTAIGNLAVAQGFTPYATNPLIADQGKSQDALITWRLGSGRTRTDVTGFAAGGPDKHQLGCWVDGEVLPDNILGALTAMLGQPSSRTVSDNGLTEVAWKIPAELSRNVVTLFFEQGKGSQRVGIYFDQFFEKGAPKP